MCGPAPSPETLVNGATVVHERLTRQALMQLARSAATVIAVEQPARQGLALAKLLARQGSRNKRQQRLRCSEWVVWGGVEPPTYRFSGSDAEYSRLVQPSVIRGHGTRIVLFCAGQAPSTGGTAARVNTSLPGCCAVSRVIGLRPRIIQCYI